MGAFRRNRLPPQHEKSSFDVVSGQAIEHRGCDPRLRPVVESQRDLPLSAWQRGRLRRSP
jgi:hypothetical protein